MSRTNYKSYTIVTQFGLLADDTARWRYKIYKREPLTDLPSDLVYSTAQEAEDAAKSHIDDMTKPPATIADLMVAIEADTVAFVRAVAKIRSTDISQAITQISHNKDE